MSSFRFLTLNCIREHSHKSFEKNAIYQASLLRHFHNIFYILYVRCSFFMTLLLSSKLNKNDRIHLTAYMKNISQFDIRLNCAATASFRLKSNKINCDSSKQWHYSQFDCYDSNRRVVHNTIFFPIHVKFH